MIPTKGWSLKSLACLKVWLDIGFISKTIFLFLIFSYKLPNLNKLIQWPNHFVFNNNPSTKIKFLAKRLSPQCNIQGKLLSVFWSIIGVKSWKVLKLFSSPYKSIPHIKSGYLDLKDIELLILFKINSSVLFLIISTIIPKANWVFKFKEFIYFNSSWYIIISSSSDIQQ